MPDDVLVSDGVLKLRAQQRTVMGGDGNSYAYTSGIISSGKDTYDPAVAPRFAFQYGYVEMRAKIPAGQGFWSAFWMLQANGQWPWEIDILEALGNQPNAAYFNVHYPTPNWDDAANPGGYSGPDFTSDFHTYAVEWAPDTIVWYIDGVERKRVTDPSQIPNAPMYLLANLQVGGDWPGSPNATTPLPANLEIDYIRVWQRGQ
jgi:beta-glucanase (GH16 family)